MCIIFFNYIFIFIYIKLSFRSMEAKIFIEQKETKISKYKTFDNSQSRGNEY